MSDRTQREYVTAVERVVLSATRNAPHAGAEARHLVRAIRNALGAERKVVQHSIRTRVGLTVAYRIMTLISERLDREVLYK